MADEKESNATRLAVMQTDLWYIKEKLNAVDEKVSTHYLTKEEFSPVKNIVYGLVMLILIAVVGALLALIMQPGPPPDVKTDIKKTAQQ